MQLSLTKYQAYIASFTENRDGASYFKFKSLTDFYHPNKADYGIVGHSYRLSLNENNYLRVILIHKATTNPDTIWKLQNEGRSIAEIEIRIPPREVASPPIVDIKQRMRNIVFGRNE